MTEGLGTGSQTALGLFYAFRNRRNFALLLGKNAQQFITIFEIPLS
jgi:hypothetical protein